MTKRKDIPDREISIRSVRRDPPDLEKASLAFIAANISKAQRETDAEAQRAEQVKAADAGQPHAEGVS